MLANNNNLTIYPLYWVYHDFWDYTQTTLHKVQKGYEERISTFDHFGHIHFFIPGFSIQNTNTQRAYDGEQYYKYSLQQVWGPNSLNPNQQYVNKVIGKPKWYFYIEEYWRRIYIQQWDNTDNDTNNKGFVGKKGIKWDASLPQHTRGVFRQGKDNYFFYTNLCRTLPIQYWHNQKKTKRDHYLRLNNLDPKYKQFYKTLGSEQWEKTPQEIATPSWDFQNDYPKLRDQNIKPNQRGTYTDFYTHFDQFTIPRGKTATGDYKYLVDDLKDGIVPMDLRYLSWSDQDGARINYADRYFISPTIQYQKVIHKNYQRLDGWQDRDLQDQQTGELFGDGYQQQIKIPYRTQVDGRMIIQSPFSDDDGKVYPAGQYFHNCVKNQDKLFFRQDFVKDKDGKDTNQIIYNDCDLSFYYNKPRKNFCYPDAYQVYSQDVNNQNKRLFDSWQSRIPNGYPIDGMWVQQCLGAIVKARVKIITQDLWGGRTQNWVQLTDFVIDDPFEGKDF